LLDNCLNAKTEQNVENKKNKKQKKRGDRIMRKEIKEFFGCLLKLASFDQEFSLQRKSFFRNMAKKLGIDSRV